MQIKVEELDTQKIINFYPSQQIKTAERLIVVGKTAKSTNAMLDNIMHINGIERCMAAEDILSVKHNKENAEDIRILVMAELDDFVAENGELKPENPLSAKERAEAVADALIRPTLNRDNGNIEIHSVDNGIIELSFTGHCAGCPYAQNTLQNVVTRTFLRYMPELKEVKLKG